MLVCTCLSIRLFFIYIRLFNDEFSINVAHFLEFCIMLTQPLVIPLPSELSDATLSRGL